MFRPKIKSWSGALCLHNTVVEKPLTPCSLVCAEFSFLSVLFLLPFFPLFFLLQYISPSWRLVLPCDTSTPRPTPSPPHVPRYVTIIVWHPFPRRQIFHTFDPHRHELMIGEKSAGGRGGMGEKKKKRKTSRKRSWMIHRKRVGKAACIMRTSTGGYVKSKENRGGEFVDVA